VTFLLTDVEGSTRLWEREPEAMRHALARHDAIVATGVRRLHGHVLKAKGEGDSIFAVFHRVRDAVAAALVVQCALASEQWPTTTPLRVRMAIHTGRVDLRDGDYYGPTVNRCARLRALATGGQVLLSGAAAQLAQSHLPSGATLDDLGHRQLKDLSAPERVWQLRHPRMAPLASATAAEPAPSAPRAPSRQGFVLTDPDNRTGDGRWLLAGATRTASQEGGFVCYASPKLAALLNPLYEGISFPRLWEVRIDDAEPEPDQAVRGATTITALRLVSLPTLSPRDQARFAVVCARAAYTDGPLAGQLDTWVCSWLAGEDSSGVGARSLADTLEAEAHRGTGMANPPEVMAAKAARAAMVAARLAWLSGRTREEEGASAVELAEEAVRMALKMAPALDLQALADLALPSVGATGVPARPTAAPPIGGRILSPLPA